MADGNEYTLTQMMEGLGAKFRLTESDLTDLIPSGRQTRFYNRVCWSTTHLKKAAIIESLRRGTFRITPRGLELLRKGIERIDLPLLSQYPEYMEFQRLKGPKKSLSGLMLPSDKGEKTPDELLFESYLSIREALASEIIENIKSCSPAFFERLVVELLVRMGYGGTLKDAGQAIGRSGDGGIDGIIKEDRLGLDVIFVQAKRWGGNVSRPELQKFAGALLGKQARKGVFITTSGFTAEAKQYVGSIGSNIILIDGDELADLMIDYNVGVSVAANYEIKKIDSDYFIEE